MEQFEGMEMGPEVGGGGGDRWKGWRDVVLVVIVLGVLGVSVMVARFAERVDERLAMLDSSMCVVVEDVRDEVGEVKVVVSDVGGRVADVEVRVSELANVTRDVVSMVDDVGIRVEALGGVADGWDDVLGELERLSLAVGELEDVVVSLNATVSLNGTVQGG